jgi:ribosome-binding ATPase
MRIGICGLPRVGKTTVFHLLTGEHAAATKVPGPAIGIAKVAEPRLDRLAAIFRPKKVTPVTVECLDFPALTRGGKASDVEASLLAQLRQVDCILQVIRHFEDARVPHEEGTVDPVRDMALLDTLFLLADLGVVEKRIQKITEDVGKARKDAGQEELPLLERCHTWLMNEQSLREMGLTAQEEKSLRGYAFLTLKPLLLLLNMGEEKIGEADPVWEQLQNKEARSRTGCVRLPAKTEWELSRLTPEEGREFSQALGLETLEHPSILGRSLELSTRITFFTVVGEELRAWPFPRGGTALEAAGTIHTDMEKGFVKAEVIGFQGLAASGSMAAARKQGLVRLEGKGYGVQDGDILTIRFTK